MNTPQSEPQLAPPGAGVPLTELLIIRPVFRMVRLLWSDARASRQFKVESARLLKLASGLSPQQGTERVLIERITGIEDSSRYWSPFMVLQHLRIVNDGIAGIVERLAQGLTVPREVRTADVKPNPAAGVEAIEEFRDCTERYLARVGAALQHSSRVKHAHPWFGPLDAHGWHCLGAVHAGIHRRQLTAILKRLQINS
jgi:hypothetical protein